MHMEIEGPGFLTSVVSYSESQEKRRVGGYSGKRLANT